MQVLQLKHLVFRMFHSLVPWLLQVDRKRPLEAPGHPPAKRQNREGDVDDVLQVCIHPQFIAHSADFEHLSQGLHTWKGQLRSRADALMQLIAITHCHHYYIMLLCLRMPFKGNAH